VRELAWILMDVGQSQVSAAGLGDLAAMVAQGPCWVLDGLVGQSLGAVWRTAWTTAGSRAPHERPMGWKHAVVGTSGTASRKYEGHGGLCD
jgi:hypothetical protein